MSTSVGIHIKGSASIAGKQLFEPLNMHIKAGQWSCLLGPSGVGKSTLLYLLSDLASHVNFDGTIVADDGLPLAGRISYMAQTDLLMPWLSILDNTLIGQRLRGDKPDIDKAEKLLAGLGLSEHSKHHPSQLSGGQRQRVALARTLMEEKEIVLLDEPFSALDARTRADMQELSAQWLEGKTVLHVTHDPAEAARLGEQIFLLSESGLRQMEVPTGAIVRPVDDPDTLACQGQLLKILREVDS
ncbi:MAG: ABC transporter ATP-binding protein [Sulfurovum sp.]|nr:ABC transporter ATP-binding protein [Sulfurovum sp.]